MNNKILGTIIIFLAFVMIGTGIVLQSLKDDEPVEPDSSDNTNTDKKDDNDTDDTETPEQIAEKVEKILANLSYDLDCTLLNNSCLLKVHNNSDEVANVVLSEITLSDIFDNQIGFFDGPLYSNGLGPYKTGYITITKSKIMGLNDQSYDVCDAYFTIQTWFKSIPHNDEVEILDTYDDGEKIIATLKNNSEDVLDSVEVLIFYYKNDKLIATQKGIDMYSLDDEYLDELNPNQEVNISLDYPYSNGFSGDVLEYDRYEIIINEAYKTVTRKR